jgi:hypothetical protein
MTTESFASPLALAGTNTLPATNARLVADVIVATMMVPSEECV